MAVKTTLYNNAKGNNNRRNQRKEDRTYEHCKAPGHLKESCFKLHGYPDWYKQPKKDKAAVKGYANATSSSFDAEGGIDEKKETLMAKCSPTMTEIIQQEISRILKNKQPAKMERVNFAQLDDFVGNTFKTSSLNDDLHKWIIDIRATNHICAVRNLFVSLKPLTQIFFIHLPNGSTKIVQFYGNVRLHETLCLKIVLYIPSFKHNLLSVSRLSKTHDLKLNFYPTFCALQDQKTDRTIVVGRERINYIFWIKDPFLLMLSKLVVI